MAVKGKLSKMFYLVVQVFQDPYSIFCDDTAYMTNILLKINKVDLQLEMRSKVKSALSTFPYRSQLFKYNINCHFIQFPSLSALEKKKGRPDVDLH